MPPTAQFVVIACDPGKSLGGAILCATLNPPTVSLEWMGTVLCPDMATPVEFVDTIAAKLGHRTVPVFAAVESQFSHPQSLRCESFLVGAMHERFCRGTGGVAFRCSGVRRALIPEQWFAESAWAMRRETIATQKAVVAESKTASVRRTRVKAFVRQMFTLLLEHHTSQVDLEAVHKWQHALEGRSHDAIDAFCLGISVAAGHATVRKHIAPSKRKRQPTPSPMPIPRLKDFTGRRPTSPR